jgi:hypothetical protein
LYQVQIALEENAEMALDQRAQFIIEAVREGKESEALNRSYEFPTAWQRIRSAMRAYRYQSLVFRCAGQEDDNVVDFLP